MRTALGLDKHAERIEKRQVEFAKICASSETLSDWFPTRTASLVYSRREGITYRHYLEEPSRTERKIEPTVGPVNTVNINCTSIFSL